MEDLIERAAEFVDETVVVYDALFLALAEDAAEAVMVNADDKPCCRRSKAPDTLRWRGRWRAGLDLIWWSRTPQGVALECTHVGRTPSGVFLGPFFDQDSVNHQVLEASPPLEVLSQKPFLLHADLL